MLLSEIAQTLLGIRDPASDIDTSSNEGLTYDGVGLLRVLNGGSPTVSIAATIGNIRTPLFDVSNTILLSLTAGNPDLGTIWAAGLAYNNTEGRETLYIADRRNARVWAITRRSPARPNTAVIIYEMFGAPRGMRLNPLTRTRVGAPEFGTSREGPNADGRYLIDYLARNTSGVSHMFQEMTVLPGTEKSGFVYTYSGFPEWYKLVVQGGGTAETILTVEPTTENSLVTLPEGIDKQTHTGIVTARNRRWYSSTTYNTYCCSTWQSLGRIPHSRTPASREGTSTMAFCWHWFRRWCSA